MSVAALGSCTPEDISLISRRPVTRRRRVMASLVLAGGLAGIIGVVTGGTAAWAVMAVAVALGLAYTGALVHMRRLAEAREISRAFGRHPGWESFAREPAIFPDDQPDRVAAVADRPGDVAKFLAAWLLASLLTPLIVVIRLLRGSQLEEQGVLGGLLRAREYAQLHSLRVLGMSAVATAGITGGGIAAAGAPAGASVRVHAPTAVSASVPTEPAISSAEFAAVTSNVGQYTVRPGDTLNEIAEAYGVSVAALAKANGIADPNVVVVDRVLRVQLPEYTVGRGDTLAGISKNFGLPVSELAAANGISDPNKVVADREVKVGGGDLPAVQHWTKDGSDPAAATSAGDPPAPPLVGSGTYTVQAGDTLFSIARRFDTWTNSLVQANHLASANAIVVGQVLQVGGQGANKPATAPAPAAVPTPAADPPAPPLVGSGTYTVQQGDTLLSIARRFRTWTNTLVQANHLPSANAIRVGQVLQVGGQGANKPKPVAAPAPTRPAAPPLVGSGTYTVQRGDTLVSIARRFHTWTSTLVEVNHLANADSIKAGQVLQVGGGGGHADADDYSHAAPVHAAPRPAPAPPRAPARVAPAPMSAFEACVIHRESSGNPNAWNASGHWGLFQFSESTWVEYGGSAAEFGHASAAEQQRVFDNAMARGGEFNWAPYDGC